MDDSGEVTFRTRDDAERNDSEADAGRGQNLNASFVEPNMIMDDSASVNGENVAIVADSEVMCDALRKSCESMERQIRMLSVESTRQVHVMQQQTTTHLSQQNEQFISEIHQIREEIKSLSNQVQLNTQLYNEAVHSDNMAAASPPLDRNTNHGFGSSRSQGDVDSGALHSTRHTSTPVDAPAYQPLPVQPQGPSPVDDQRSYLPIPVQSQGPPVDGHRSYLPSPVQPQGYANSKLHMRPQTYDGSEDLNEYLAQFDILAEINGWGYNSKSLYLAGSLKGGARALLSELNHAQQRDYDALVRVLSSRYGSVNRAEMFRAQLQTRVRSKDESLPELAQSVKKLTRLSYPSAPVSVTDILALDHFIDSLSDADMRLRIRESRPRDIGEAETLSVRLETYRLADSQRSSKTVRAAGSLSATSANDEIKTCDDDENFTGKNDVGTVLRTQLDLFRQEMAAMSTQVEDMIKSENNGNNRQDTPYKNQNWREQSRRQNYYGNNNGNHRGASNGNDRGMSNDRHSSRQAWCDDQSQSEN
jgi:hypothetical protein